MTPSRKRLFLSLAGAALIDHTKSAGLTYPAPEEAARYRQLDLEDKRQYIAELESKRRSPGWAALQAALLSGALSGGLTAAVNGGIDGKAGEAALLAGGVGAGVGGLSNYMDVRDDNAVLDKQLSRFKSASDQLPTLTSAPLSEQFDAMKARNAAAGASAFHNPAHDAAGVAWAQGNRPKAPLPLPHVGSIKGSSNALWPSVAGAAGGLVRSALPLGGLLNPQTRPMIEAYGATTKQDHETVQRAYASGQAGLQGISHLRNGRRFGDAPGIQALQPSAAVPTKP